jgi:hypothetical protein
MDSTASPVGVNKYSAAPDAEYRGPNQGFRVPSNPRNCHRAGEGAQRSSTALKSTVAGSRIRSDNFLVSPAPTDKGEAGAIP